MKGVGVSDLVWRRSSGALMEIPAGLLAKVGGWGGWVGAALKKLSTSSAAFYFKSVFSILLFVRALSADVCCGARSVGRQIKYNFVSNPRMKRCFIILQFHTPRKSHTHKNCETRRDEVSGWCGEKNDETSCAVSVNTLGHSLEDYAV